MDTTNVALATAPTCEPRTPIVLVVGHIAGTQLFGGERSLLDVLDGFAAIGINTVVAIPETQNTEYLYAIQQRCLAVHGVPIPPRHPRQDPDTDVIGSFMAIISEHRIDAVHCNTVVPREPLIAARRAGIPAVVHAREIPAHDPALCRWLDATPEELVASVLAETDYLIANSRTTSATYPLAGRTSVVPNAIDVRQFDNWVRAPGAVRIGLVSAATERKGLLEFIEIARLLESGSDASFRVIGPRSKLSDQLETSGNLPTNLVFAGYAPNPVEAISQVDILVNLSRCHESFGRTVLEAMAARLPVVAFARGALPELVRDGHTGFLIPFGDVRVAALRIEQLINDPALRSAMGDAGRQVAEEQFSPQMLARSLRASYRAILPRRSASSWPF